MKKGEKWGKNTEIFIQIGIIFVKKASSILFSKHFHDTCDTFLKSSGFGEFRSKIQNYAFLTKKLRKSIFKLLWIIFFKWRKYNYIACQPQSFYQNWSIVLKMRRKFAKNAMDIYYTEVDWPCSLLMNFQVLPFGQFLSDFDEIR